MEGKPEVDVVHVVEVLRECPLYISFKNNSCAVDQNVKSSELLNDPSSHFELLLVVCQVSVNNDGLGGEFFTNISEGVFISSD